MKGSDIFGYVYLIAAILIVGWIISDTYIFKEEQPFETYPVIQKTVAEELEVGMTLKEVETHFGVRGEKSFTETTSGREYTLRYSYKNELIKGVTIFFDEDEVSTMIIVD